LHACGNAVIGKNGPADKAGNQSFARKSVNDGPGGFPLGLLFQFN